MLACRSVGRQLVVGVQESLGESFMGGQPQLDMPGGHTASIHTQEPELGGGLQWLVAVMLGREWRWDVGTLHEPSVV